MPNISTGYYLTLFFLLIYTIVGFSQTYSIENFQKINEIQGGFSGNLDDNDSFGVAMDNIGDLDGNGVNDLAVGAFSDDDGGSNKGAVWILFLGNNDQIISHTKISNTSGGFNGVLDNEDRFGGGVSFLGDMNNDGLIEIAVTSDYDGDGGFWHGAIWILSLKNDGTVSSHVKISDTQGDFTGLINGDAIFGTDIENIGDLNGDGIQDLAVGSRRDNDGGGNEGALWILFLNSDFTVNSFQKISETQGGLALSLDFEDYFGGAVASLGDLDGDGVTDLAVGSYRDDDLSQNSGSFYVLFLNINGTVKSTSKISNLSGGFGASISPDALFGESIDGIVDLDMDGKIEILIGAMKYINPTLSIPTGAFFIVELNNDGTVSDEYLYTFAENCFSGQLQNGDLFGGSVTFLNTDLNNIKIAVGAYRDSENGFRKGAAWILNLGEVVYSISSTDPSDCGVDDGTITISGLNANANYVITYNYEGTPVSIMQVSDVSGMLSFTGLPTGMYDAIVVTEDATGCTDNLGQVELTASPLMAMISSADPSYCGIDDGRITISGLNANTDYTITYNYEGTPVNVMQASDVSGMLSFTGLPTGMYDAIVVTEDATGCTDNLGQVELIASPLMAIINSTDTSDCGIDDGRITISGLNANTDYTITYNYEGTPVNVMQASDVSGILSFTGLPTGMYDAIVVTEDATGCTDNLGQMELTASPLMAMISSTDPSDCGIDDGRIAISGLNTNVNYTIAYNYDGTPVSIMEISDGSGIISIIGLPVGIYDTIVVTEDATGCTDNLGQLELICFYSNLNCFKTKKYFTPNGDGYNDYWSLELLSNSCNYELYIFNRYGKLLKTLTPSSNKWYGVFNGKKMPSDDYWYLVEYEFDDKKLRYSSHFALKR